MIGVRRADFVPPIFAAASISGDVEVSAAVDISLDILGEIKGFIATAKADIQAAIDVNADLLVLNGETLAVKAVAEIVATLVIVRFPFLLSFWVCLIHFL